MKKLLLLLLITPSLLLAYESDNNIQIKGFSSFQTGQVHSGSYNNLGDIDKYWYQKVFANIGVFKKVKDWLSVTAAIEVSYETSFIKGTTFPETEFFIPNVYIDEARGDIGFINSENINLKLTTGYFKYQYNTDVTNLGNNLFKSYCYPTALVEPEFDFPYTRLTGLNLNFLFKDLLSNDLFITTHTKQFPLGDFSIADIVGIKPLSGIKFLAGVQFDRMFPVKSKETTPKNAQFIDGETGDTIKLTYEGIKLMGHLSLDLKKLIFGDEYPAIFGEEDMKLWGEINLLGLKNYSMFYDTLKHRIPISFGIKLPTFKILDVFAVEAEYWPSPYPNSVMKVLNQNNIIPDDHFYEFSHRTKEDDWKWSVYLRKDISALSLRFQIARDHLQLWSSRPVDRVWRDNLIASDNFWYQFKIMYNF